MKCEDCGFEHSETGACPHCGYDPAADLVAAVRLPSPPVENPLEREFAAICKEVDEGKTSKERARQHWERVNDKARRGDLDARHLVGRMALSQKDYPAALKIFTALADGGHALAAFDLGKMYDEGLGAEQDEFKAIRLFRSAAAKGNPVALFYIARQHLQGGLLRADKNLADAIMTTLAEVHPTMFTRNAGCPGCPGGLSNAEFAQKTASDLSKMIKYLLWGVIIAVIVAIVKSEM